MRSSRFSIFILCLGACLIQEGVFAEPPPGRPVANPLSRYQAMMERSPFAVASHNAAAPSAAIPAGFAKDLVLTGAARLTGGEYITVASRDGNVHFSLRTGQTYNGISIASIEWSSSAGKTNVTLKQGNEYSVIGFDEAASGSGPEAAPNASANVPAQKPVAGSRWRSRAGKPPPDS